MSEDIDVTVGSSRAPGQRPMTFETFVHDETNDFAYTMAVRFAAQPSAVPLLMLHGDSIGGKSHLLSAIRHHLEETHPEMTLFSLTREHVSRRHSTDTWDALLHSVEESSVVFVDDLHEFHFTDKQEYIMGRLLSERIQKDRPTVIAAQTSLNDMKSMDERVRKSLQGAVQCHIDPPSECARQGIVESAVGWMREEEQNPDSRLSAEAIKVIASKCVVIPQLMGLIRTLYARYDGKLNAITQEIAQQVVREHLGIGHQRVTVDQIQKAVCEFYGLRQTEMIGERRSKAISRPRQMAMWIARKITTRSQPDIGRRFGGRDHTTVLHAVRRIEALKAEDKGLARDIEIIISKLLAR